MNNQDAIQEFLAKALKKRWKSRHLDLVMSKRGKGKFLDTLFHNFGEYFDSSKVTVTFESEIWAQPAYVFGETVGFGSEASSLREAYDTLPWDGGWLIIDQSGKHGIYRPETYIDNEVFISV